MRLALENVNKKNGAEDYLYPLSLALVPGTINVLLGTTRAGKTTLMRMMAGLDKPSEGQIMVDGRDVTGVPVRERNLAMVYQQFINYPSHTVFENIASPLRLRKVPAAEIRKRVMDMAERLHITPYLNRLPAELSGGQQQRTALARALIKESDLLLLDEPLVNLDYKLREELRQELTDLFSEGKTTVVYATTEPLEALQLGGHTVVLHEGRLLQQGRTLDVFNAPSSIQAARTFSDPPINLMRASIDAQGVAQLGAGIAVQLSDVQRQRAASAQGKEVILGLRAHGFRLAGAGQEDAAQHAQHALHTLEAEVDLAEISGSETFVHAHRGPISLVAQLPGVHDIAIGTHCRLAFRPGELFIFDTGGQLLFAPSAHETGSTAWRA